MSRTVQILFTCVAGASATANAAIAGYVPFTDVIEHNEIDLDQADIETELKKSPKDFVAATGIYANGANSVKSSGATRTIKGFSKDLTGEPEYDKFVAYYGDLKYADKWVSAALSGGATGFTSGNGDANFATVPELGADNVKTREQAVKKGTVYLNIWMYALHELESAMGKCSPGGDSTANTAAAHAWDEGVAFYTGSLVGTDGSTSSGKLMYALAQKRCSDFSTCDATSGTAKSNLQVFRDFELGLSKIIAGNCAGLRPIADRIAAYGFLPIIQGAIKYGTVAADWSATESGSGDSPNLAKAKAEGATFAAAVLGRLNACDSAAATTIYNNLGVGAASTSKSAVVAAFESNYACLGILCSDVGAYGSATPCTDVWPAIAGYAPGTNVLAHNAIDLDQAAMQSAVKASAPDYVAAMSWYSSGGNSVKSSGSARTIKGFSKDLTGEPEYDKFKAYYGDTNYADKWVTAAMLGTATGFSGMGNADFAAVGDADTKEQAIKKGTVYLNIWMYAIHELEAAIGKCSTSSTDNNEGAVHAWDEGVAFYTGTLQGTDGSGSGKLMYAVAQSRCSNFKTCGASGTSTSGTAKANLDIFAAFDQGKADLQAGSCSAIRASADTIIAKGFIPIIQGVLKYAWAVGVDGAGLKYKAEAAVFSAGLLGRLHACSATDAATVYENTKIGAATTDFAAVKAALEANYECMGVTCAEIGGYVNSDGTYREGFSAGCSAASGGGLGTGALVGIIVGAVVVVGIVVLVAVKMMAGGKAGAKGAAV